MPKIVIDVTAINPANQIIDILKGDAMVYISNPYCAPECITKINEDDYFKFETGSYIKFGLKMPDLYINYSEGVWTKDYYIQYGSKNKKIGYKILPPYDKDKKVPEKFEKANQKFQIQLGLLTDEKKQIVLVEWQICQAYEFAIYSKLFGIDISKYQTDKEFIDEVVKCLGSDEDMSEEIGVYLDNINNKIVNIKFSKKTDEEDMEEEIDYFDLGLITFEAFNNYLKAVIKILKNTDKINPCIQYFYKSKKARSVTIKPKFKVIQFDVKDDKTGLMKPIESVNFQGKFSVVYDMGKQEKSKFYITKCSNPVVKRGIHPITIEDFQFADRLKFSGYFIISLKPICGIYNITKETIMRSETIDWEINQIVMHKNEVTTTDEILIEEDDIDEDNKEADNQSSNDAAENGVD